MLFAITMKLMEVTMSILLLTLLIPLTLFAQVSFAPRRVDDSVSSGFYYPTVERHVSGSLFCTWAEISDSAVAAYGRRVSLNGDFLNAPFAYQYGSPEEFTCPAKLYVLHLSGGGEARMIFHS